MDNANARSDITFECKVHFKDGRRGRKKISEGDAPIPRPIMPGSIPRISRLMALAIRFEGLVNRGEVQDYADLARLGFVSRARITQIMNLLHLAPDIQEGILFFTRTMKGRDPITERDIRPIAAIIDWRQQRRLWSKLTSDRTVHPVEPTFQ